MARGTTSAALGKVLKRVEKLSIRDVAATAGTRKAPPTEVTELVASVLAAGIRANASAIHIEPRSDGVHIRHRIDRILSEAQVLPRSVAPVLIAGLKILAHLPVDENESLPLQSATSVTVQDKPYRLRIATMPTEAGEKAVVQLTSLSGKAPTLQQLGYWGPSLNVISDAMTKTKGLIILAGPHDAGKAESAYSILSHLASPEVSISTIENPITYRIPGATQTQVNTRIGLDFATGLRTLLRQDPNIVMASNLPDSDTVRLCVDGALSGRLVIAGLQSPSAANAIGYLLATGVEPYLVAHSLQTVVGQRAVRRLCDNCKQIYTPDETEMISILKSLGVKTAAQLQRVRELQQQAIQEKVVSGASPEIDKSFISALYRPAKDGCADCSHTGYKGSIGIYEALQVSENIQRLILANTAAQIIQDQAASEGMPTMQMDGLVKVLLGLTSTDEVASATQS